ncbi:WD repeat-containing protein 74 [Phlebotomus argentipes]|uniref:WD repeat-containing protein 74 n=1 Tax=Phlebotomus argentipes TaxID=94469 RepID=UPI0028933D59|nr:WD repeat-containing protein 74 [Phlebotomus argentipes]
MLQNRFLCAGNTVVITRVLITVFVYIFLPVFVNFLLHFQKKALRNMISRNSKQASYTERNRVYVGSQVGALKAYDLVCEHPYKPTNLQKVSDLEQGQGITTMRWGNDEESKILIGRNDSAVQIYDLHRNAFTVARRIPEGAVVGVCRVGEKFIGASSLGKIHILGDEEDEIQTLSTGTDMTRMRQCRENPKLLATGGKERKNCLKVWNIEEETPIFTSKNVPHDSLQLEVPVWDSDINFLDSNTLVTSSRYGYIRTYDIRKQRRPVLQFVPKEEHMSFSCMNIHANLIYVGLTTGGIRAFDSRSLKFPVHTYKGSIGSITDLTLDKTGKFLCSTSLERYVRIHSTINNVILYQCYVKTKPSQVLLKTAEKSANEEESNEKHTEDSDDEEDLIVDEDFTNDKLLKRLKRKRKFSS